MNLRKINVILNEVFLEREKQHAKWGEQNHPNGTGSDAKGLSLPWPDAARAKAATEVAAQNGTLTFRHILDEEVKEAFAESDINKLREELIQVAAVAVAWIESIDRKINKSEI